MLNEIRFNNFKCFEDATIKLNKLTVLTGLNGMGKSTVIQGILALRQSYLMNNLNRGLELSGKYIDLGNGQDILYEKAVKDEKITITLVDDIKKKYCFEYEANALTLKNADENYTQVNDIIKTNKFIYLAADRIIPRKRYDIGNPEDVDNRDFGNDGEFVLQYLNDHGTETDEGNKEKNLNIELEKWMEEISPGAEPVVTLNPDNQLADLKFRFREGKYMTNPYKAINVGFGLTYVLPVVVSLLTAREGDYIIIENPEAHIHPRGQRKLGELISLAVQNGAQVILETHSDHVMNGIRLAVKTGTVSKDEVGFVYFYKDVSTYEHLCLYPQIDENGKFDFWPNGFFDEWENSLMELL